jgi:hypothetical protein
MNMAAKNKSYARTTHGLRDMLFDEIERMQTAPSASALGRMASLRCGGLHDL